MKRTQLVQDADTTRFFVAKLLTEEKFDLFYCAKCNFVFEEGDTVLQRIQGAEKSYLACPIRKTKKLRFFGEIVDTCAFRLEGWANDFIEKEHVLFDIQ